MYLQIGNTNPRARKQRGFHEGRCGRFLRRPPPPGVLQSRGKRGCSGGVPHPAVPLRQAEASLRGPVPTGLPRNPPASCNSGRNRSWYVMQLLKEMEDHQTEQQPPFLAKGCHLSWFSLCSFSPQRNDFRPPPLPAGLGVQVTPS